MATGTLEKTDVGGGWMQRLWCGWVGGWWGLVEKVLRGMGPVAVVGVLVYLGGMVAAYKISIVRDIQFVGHADDAAYVAMAQGLVRGEGLNVHYVSFFFQEYPEGVVHREDHWPPFMGFAIAPFLWFYGAAEGGGGAAWVAKLAPILIGSIGLPVLTALLGMAYSRRGYVGLAAGLLMLGNSAMFTQSLRAASDVPAAMLVAGFCWAMIAGRRRGWMLVVAGVFAAAAYYAKGSEILLLGLMPVMWMLIADKAGMVSLYAIGGLLAVAADYVLGWGSGAVVGWLLVVLLGNAGWVGWRWSRRSVSREQLGDAQRGPLRHWAWHAWILPCMQIMVGVVGLLGFFWTRQPMVLAGAAVVAMGVAGLPALVGRDGKWIWMGMATAVLLLGPWWYSNWKLYGNPLHSTQNYVSGYMGLEDWETGTYSVYWGKTPPRTADRWEKYGDTYWAYAAENREFYARCALTGALNKFRPESWDDFGAWGGRARNWLLGERLRDPDAVVEAKGGVLGMRPVGKWSDPVTELPGAAAIVTMMVLVVVTPVGMGAWWLGKRWKGGISNFRFQISKDGVQSTKGEAQSSESKSQISDFKSENSEVKPQSSELRPQGSEFKRQSAERKARSSEEAPWLVGPALALGLVAVAQWLFVAMLWGRLDMERLTFVFLPLLAVVGCTGVARVVEWPVSGAVGFWRWKWPGKLADLARWWHVPVTVAAAVWVMQALPGRAEELKAYHAREVGSLDMSLYPYSDDFPYSGPAESVALGKWMGEHAPEAVFMCRNPWEALFYAARTNRGVTLPVGTAEEIFAVCRRYHVKYLVCDTNRPALAPYLRQSRPGLKPVAGGSRGVYEVDYAALGELGTKTPGL